MSHVWGCFANECTSKYCQWHLPVGLLCLTCSLLPSKHQSNLISTPCRKQEWQHINLAPSNADLVKCMSRYLQMPVDMTQWWHDSLSYGSLVAQCVAGEDNNEMACYTVCQHVAAESGNWQMASVAEDVGGLWRQREWGSWHVSSQPRRPVAKPPLNHSVLTQQHLPPPAAGSSLAAAISGEIEGVATIRTYAQQQRQK